jgi:FlaA1/EpsC-like NDP-sugar epimerase
VEEQRNVDLFKGKCLLITEGTGIFGNAVVDMANKSGIRCSVSAFDGSAGQEGRLT